MGKMTKKIRTIALTPFVEQGKIRIVLSWPDAPADLDLYSLFKTGKFTRCQVFYGKQECSKTRIDVDNKFGGKKGAETITIDVLEKYIYTFAVRKYVSTVKDDLASGEVRVEGAPRSSDYNYEVLPESERPELIANVTLSQSNAKLSIFIGGYKNAIREIIVPLDVENNLLSDSDKNKKYHDWWLGFCLNGSQGISSLRIVNKLTSEMPKEAYCEEIYKTPTAPVKTFFLEVNNSSKNHKMKVKRNLNEISL